MQSLHVPTTYLHRPLDSGMQVLTFGIKELDTLFEGLRCGQFNVFHGSMKCHVLSELLCVRSQLPDAMGGLESSVIFLDGGNLFDPYLISETARLNGLDPEETLKNIWISRAFTSYQMTALITERLSQILDREKSRLVVISEATTLYCDADIGSAEAKKTFNYVTLYLWNLVRERNIILLVTSSSSSSKRKRCLEQYLLGRADVAARVETGNPHIKIFLEKHPSRALASSELLEEVSAQSRIEDFLEV